MKRNFSAISVAATAALLVSASTVAQLNSPRVGSDISLVVDGGSQVSVLPVISGSGQSDLLTYDLFNNEIQLAAGVLAPDYDEPLFCFDLGGPQSSVALQVTDPNGHLIIDQFAVDFPLDYVLGVPSSLVVKPSVNQQCFYRSDQGVFGLAGQTIEAEPGDRIMSNRFEVERSISLQYNGVPEFVTVGETVSYDLVVTNTGDGDLNQVALQELFPENTGVYAAALNDTSWSCISTGDAVCPNSSADPSALRFNDLNAGGSDITEGDSLIFTIERTVDTSSATGESIRLQAGVVADPVATGTPFAVDEAVMTVVGQSAGLDVNSATTTVANDATIIVTVLDSNQNPVPDETVSLDDGAGLNFTSATTGSSNVNGQVVFTATTTVAGDYNVSFVSDALSGSGPVSFDPGPATNMVAAALVNQAIADGSDTTSINVLVEDAFGNAVGGTMVDVVDNGGLSSLPASASTDIDGEAIFSPTSTIADSFQVQLSVAGAGTDAVSVEYLPGVAEDLAFVVQPSDVEAETGGTDMTPAVVVRVVDANGNWVSDDQTTFVQLRLRQNGTTLDSSFAEATVINGEAQFATLNFDSSMVGAGYSFRAVGTTDSDIFFEDSAGTFEVTSAP